MENVFPVKSAAPLGTQGGIGVVETGFTVIKSIRVTNQKGNYMKLKLKEGCVVRKVGDNYVIIPRSGDNLNMMRMLRLNSSATFLLEQMQKGEFDREELVQLLMEKYAIDKATAEKDTDAFITKLREESLLEF
jgi:hypothetical protein